MSDNIQEITQLFPQGKEVTLKGKKVVVKPFGFGKFPKVLRLLKDLKVEEESVPKDIKDIPAAVRTMDVAALVVENSEKVVDLCVLAIDQPTAYFNDLPGDEGIELCQAIIEVNADFFVARLQPKLLVALSGLSKSVGGLLSQDLSQPATV